MRNYGGYGKKDARDMQNDSDDRQKRPKHIKTIVEDNTIYDIDLDCLECLKEKQNKE